MLTTLLIVAIVIISLGTLKPLLVPSKRLRVIEDILADLHIVQLLITDEQEYGLAANIRFFKAVRHPLTYLFWQLLEAPRLDADKLLELADLPLPEWEAQLYKDLDRLERRRFPGLLKPLAANLAAQPGVTFLDLGCGSMEVERQVLISLNRRKDHRPRIFIGVDLSPASYDIIARNFKQYASEVAVHRVEKLDTATLRSLIAGAPKQHLVVFVQADALSLLERLQPGDVDVVYSSKFKHHLPKQLKPKLDKLAATAGKVALEFDDYRTALSWIPLVLTAWSKPVLLNGALLSRLRQPAKRELVKSKHHTPVTFYNPPGSYIKRLRG